MTGRRRWIARGVIVVGLIVLVLALVRACAPPPVVRVIAVGDMACAPVDPAFNDGAGAGGECQAQAVSDVAVARQPDLVLGLGDYQYEVASEADWAAAYAPSWGRLREVTRPALGNQELKVHKANSYYAFFDDVAVEQPGYTSYDVGSWHVVVLNTNCTVVEGGCGTESPQVAWLRDDLAANSGRCILAYGHHPRWSNGIAGPDSRIAPLWKTLVDGGATLYLSGHEADYERFPPLDDAHQPDPTGVRQFVVGTGGQSLYEPQEGDAAWRDTFDPVPSEYFDAGNHGFLELGLGDGTYSWRFVTADGPITDSGSASCNAAVPD
jgi:Calcineurin-like phosphoesterase